MPYDPAKDPAAAERLAQHEHGGEMTGSAVTGEEPKRKESLGDKLKHSLGIGKDSTDSTERRGSQDANQLTMNTL